MSKNRITGGDGFWILLIGFFTAILYPKAFIIIITIAVIVFVAIKVNQHANLPTCQSCGNKMTLAFLHRKIDGSPDLRYKHNPLVCQHCHTDPSTFTKLVNSNDAKKNTSN